MPNAETNHNRLDNHLVHHRPTNRLHDHRTNNHRPMPTKELVGQIMPDKIMVWTYEMQVELARYMGVSVTTAKKQLRDIAARENVKCILESKPRSK